MSNKRYKNQPGKFIVRDLRGKFLRIENAALELVSAEGAKAIAVYAWICWHADNKTEVCYPSFATLAEKCKVSRRTVIRIIRFLEAIKLVGIDRTQRGDHGAMNIYYLLPAKSKDAIKLTGDNRDTSISPVTRVVTRETPVLVTPQHLKQELIEQQLLNNKAYLNKIEEFFKNPDQVWLNEIKAAFPKINMVEEMTRMRVWLISNPEKQKKNLKRFVANWLNHPQTQQPAKSAGGSGKAYVQVTDSWLHARLGNIATKDMIKAVMRELPENVWWKVDQFLRRAYRDSHGAGFAEVERELTAEARKNREEFSALAKSIAK